MASRALGTIVLGLLAAGLLAPGSGQALVFAGAETKPEAAVPPGFPYWEQVTQRRYAGPSVIYLGAGWALTAAHVGPGQILLGGEVVSPEPASRHVLLNVDGSIADGVLFELDRSARLPKTPLIPIARTPVQPGEEVVLIGFGRAGGVSVRWSDEEAGERTGFRWSSEGRKHWGTNRVLGVGRWVPHRTSLSRTFVLRFDGVGDPEATRFEAHAATGDSGGGVFVRRAHGWELAGMMISVTSRVGSPAQTATFGDQTFVLDLTAYRGEILRWARPACANEEDDDGDGRVDFPHDPDCESEQDRDERSSGGLLRADRIVSGVAAGALLGLLGGVLFYRRRQRGSRTPSSTSRSSAD